MSGIPGVPGEPSKPARILIIEDDPVFTDVLSQILELSFGSDTVVARDFEEALEAITSSSFDLVTLDYQIPGGDGLALLEEIQRTEDPPPVVMVTAHGDERIAAEAFRHGAVGYVVKDGRARALLPETIKGVLEKEAYRKALEESEKKFRLLAENMSDNVWITDLHLNRLYTSPSVEKLLGMTPEEALTRPMAATQVAESFDLITDVLLEELGREDSGADPDRTRTLEHQVMRKDGTTAWVESIAKFLRDDDGKAVAILGVTRDISDRKKALEELRESDERFRIIVANIPGYTWTTDLELTLTYVSPSVSKLGYEVEELIGRSLREVVTPESFRSAAELLARELEIADGTFENPATVFRMELLARDGNAVRVEVSAGFLRDGHGRPYGLLGSAREIE